MYIAGARSSCPPSHFGCQHLYYTVSVRSGARTLTHLRCPMRDGREEMKEEKEEWILNGRQRIFSYATHHPEYNSNNNNHHHFVMNVTLIHLLNLWFGTQHHINIRYIEKKKDFNNDNNKMSSPGIQIIKCTSVYILLYRINNCYT